MTYRRRWTMHFPIFGDVRRSKILAEEYSEDFTACRWDEDEGRASYDFFNFRVLSPDTSIITTRYPGYPTSYERVVEKDAIKPYFTLRNEHESIEPKFPGILDSLDGRNVSIEWEPTLPPQSRR